MRIVIPYINFHGRSFNDPVMIGGLEYFIKRAANTLDDTINNYYGQCFF